LYEVEHIIYGNLEVFYFFYFFVSFYYFFTNLKGDPQGGWWWLEKWTIIPGALGKVRWGYPPYPRRIRHPFVGGILLKFEFHFSNFELLSPAHRLSIRQRYTPLSLVHLWCIHRGVTVNRGRPSQGGPGWSYPWRILDTCAGGNWVITDEVDKMHRRQ
jgi:hypothetical protein